MNFGTGIIQIGWQEAELWAFLGWVGFRLFYLLFYLLFVLFVGGGLDALMSGPNQSGDDVG